MKGIGSLIEAMRRNYDKLCCIVSNTSQSNVLLANVATEQTMQSILTAIDMARDYEVRLIVDDSDVTWMEVRYWDEQDGILGTPVYYEPGSIVAGTPSGASTTWTYINPNTLLSQLLAESLDQGLTLDNIETNTNTQTLTPGILRLTTSGTIAAGANSISIANVGVADGTILGQTLKVGETISFDAGRFNTLTAVAYDASATEFLIITLV